MGLFAFDFFFLILYLISQHHSGGFRAHQFLSVLYTHLAVMTVHFQRLVFFSFSISFCSMFTIIITFNVRMFVHFERVGWRDKDVPFAKKTFIRSSLYHHQIDFNVIEH